MMHVGVCVCKHFFWINSHVRELNDLIHNTSSSHTNGHSVITNVYNSKGFFLSLFGRRQGQRVKNL